MENKIGIDLGTTYSCVAVWKNNKIEIIPNSQSGLRTVASAVYFKKNEILIGNLAKNQLKNYENVIYDSKRLIGRNFTDKEVQNDMKYFSFKLESDKNNKPIIIVTINNEKKSYSPEDISSMILKQLKKDAEDYLGCEVKDAIITVPANFNNSQRQSTIDAGKIAGLNVFQTINEPTAAAIAYGLENQSDKKKNVCVFDFGGGTFDVTVLTIKNKEFNVLSTGGDSHLGGADIDNLLVKYCIDEFKRQTNIDISNNQKALRRLKTNCERVKMELSSIRESFIDIDSLVKENDFYISIDRSIFEELCNLLFEKCINILDKTIKESKLSKDEIDDIVLVGGSTRIPKIQEMVSQFFEHKKKINKSINPDEAIAYGAAVLAISKDLDKIANLDDLIIADVLPKSLGIRVQGGIMAKIIDKNTPLPCSDKRRFANSADYMSSVKIRVYEGENEYVDDNDFLGEFDFGGITIAKKGETAVWVTFKVDQRYSLLEVYAEEEGTKNSLSKVIQIKKK